MCNLTKLNDFLKEALKHNIDNNVREFTFKASTSQLCAIVNGLDLLEKITDGDCEDFFEKDEEVRFCEAPHDSPYEKTVAGMLSTDYKERFRAEYQQLKIRLDKLNAFCNRIEAARERAHARLDEPKHDCPWDMLMRQLCSMREYLHILEVRAVIEGIELGEIRG